MLLLGPLPTPGIARLTQEFDADLGVVISASHNRFFDNGIKFFDRSGSKLSDEVEREIEARLSEPAITLESQALGKAKRIDTARIRYQDFCAASLPDGVDLESLKIVFDGAANPTAIRYGVINVPTMILIGKDGKVHHQVVNDLPLGRNVDEMLRMIDALQFTEKYGEVCPAGWSKGEEGMKPDAEGVASYLKNKVDSL